MCVATPGKIIEIENDTAKVDFAGNTVKVNIALLDAKVGDYVLTHAGLAIEVMDPERAEDLIKLFEELEEAMHDGR